MVSNYRPSRLLISTKGILMNISSTLKLIITLFFLLPLFVQAHAFTPIQPGQEKITAGTDKVDWLKQATALAESKNWKGLIDWCRKWTKSEPRSAAAWLELGMAYSKLRRHNDAIGAYRQAVKINPGYSYA
jgi:cytochrome c-type biogenesis protein CcmH/NrfG